MDDENTTQPEQGNPNYAGRWVARVRGRIVAQGGTPEQALRASQQSRYKEKPEVTYIPLPISIHPLIEKIREILPPRQEIYLVGGAVRDMLLGRLSPDLDFALPSKGVSTARNVANALNADFVLLDADRDTARVIMKGEEGSRSFLDFAAYRGLNLEEDLRARDFTMNALAYDLRRESILDPLNGAQDLRAKLIRACSATSFSDDPVRILRAIRQAAAFNFRIDKDTRTRIKEAVDLLGLVSAERGRDELFKILSGPRPNAALRALEMLGVLPHILPELVPMKGLEQSAPHIHEVWTHTLAVMTALEDILSVLRIDYNPEETNDLFAGLLTLRLGRFRERFAAHFSKPLNADRSLRALLFFAALYHDNGKPQTKSVDETGRIRFLEHEMKGVEAAVQRARAFKLSNDEIEWLDRLIRNHMRFHAFASRLEGEKKTPSRKAIYRFFRDGGETGVDLVLLGLADLQGTRGMTLSQETWAAYLDTARILLENWWEKPEEIISPPRLLDGNELMSELKISPGPLIGKILELIRENQAAGRIENREQALNFAKEELREGMYR